MIWAFAPLAVAVLAVEPPLLQPGDRIAMVGGTLVEQMQIAGSLEAELQCRRPDWQLSFRNLGWSGDDVHGIARKRFDGPEEGFRRLLADIDTAHPTVVLVAYGFAEASDGAAAVERFEPGLRRLAGEVQQPGRRLVLISPVAMPGFRVTGYDQWMSRCQEIVARVGGELDLPVVSTDWVPGPSELSPDRLLPNAAGYATLSRLLADRLVGGQPCPAINPRLRELIVDKDELFFHRYRPQNETYLFLFRQHEQGNNAVEIPRFDPLIQAADQAIWQAAR
jgi:lysophospholipase L1-like esterase